MFFVPQFLVFFHYGDSLLIVVGQVRKYELIGLAFIICFEERLPDFIHFGLQNFCLCLYRENWRLLWGFLGWVCRLGRVVRRLSRPFVMERRCLGRLFALPLPEPLLLQLQQYLPGISQPSNERWLIFLDIHNSKYYYLMQHYIQYG